MLRTSIIVCLGGAALGTIGALLHFSPLVFGLSYVAMTLLLGWTFDPVLRAGSPFRRT